jgi:hypothetical protein
MATNPQANSGRRRRSVPPQSRASATRRQSDPPLQPPECLNILSPLEARELHVLHDVGTHRGRRGLHIYNAIEIGKLLQHIAAQRDLKVLQIRLRAVRYGFHSDSMVLPWIIKRGLKVAFDVVERNVSVVGLLYKWACWNLGFDLQTELGRGDFEYEAEKKQLDNKPELNAEWRIRCNKRA